MNTQKQQTNSDIIRTPLGRLYIESTRNGIIKILWFNSKNDETTEHTAQLKTSKCLHIQTATQQIEEYFNGQRKVFNFNYELKGTLFQKKVWGELKKIPYGQTLSYKEIAQKLGRPKASQAIGQANKANPLCLMIPCHRVIKNDLNLGGYNGGGHIKKSLLDFESELKINEEHPIQLFL